MVVLQTEEEASQGLCRACPPGSPCNSLRCSASNSTEQGPSHRLLKLASSATRAGGSAALGGSSAAREASAEGEMGYHFETDDFHWTAQGISHPRRRRQILAKYPEIEALNGYDLYAGAYAIAVTLLNIFFCYKISQWQLSWPWVIFLTYCISGTLNHVLFLSMHEASHCALFPGRMLHELYVVFSNLSMGVPAGMGFLRYHLDHHVYMGTDKLDPDIPSRLEAKLFRSWLGKLVFVLLLPFTYSLRPMIRNPKPIVPMEAFNWAAILLWDMYVYLYWGPKALLYLVLGTFFSMSIHPLNGHLIAEHYQFPRGQGLQETWSSYGPENLITFCAGYHIEHHDFPRVPGYRLPTIRKIASEFYDLPHHKSWLGCVIEFICNPKVSPYSRVKRICPRGGRVQPPHKPMLKEPEELGSYWLGPTKDQAVEKEQTDASQAEKKHA
ncbi:sphingolipid delta(4)-desaturase DES1 [Cyclospora cayetanensis]|uniref:Sphingolipid delta 4 desaturase c-4 hydroxylase protein des2 family protein n=2 Tax=Cyclospora cayetanensis TaxID=88456 RepID=A0A1D3CTJ1_9EIME|nr:sphingolipid delta(4)-desaturase DES1 [Cyclospora cayetanensis]OEH74503.1 sphingolipid delta 4 desaturase c-4 hydroxylase protein des2 family protein [Cyclospora cayetanensis]